MKDTIPNLRWSLQKQIDAWGFRSGGLLNALLLKHGTPGVWSPHKYKMMRQKQCFENATLMSARGLTYVEGIAMKSDLGIPLHHAWNLDPAGNVIDVTWRKAEGSEYLGIPFEHSVLSRWLLENGVYGILDTGIGYNLPLLREIDAALVDEAFGAMRARAS
jgi:hypothetical protein